MNTKIHNQLKTLRLPGLAATLEVRLQEARANRLDHLEFLELLLQDEEASRHDRKFGRLLKAADFRNLRPLDQFDWQFNPNIDRSRIFELATCRFVREHRDAIFIGPPGTGKTHLAQAIGHQAVKLGLVVLYRSIFDLARDFLIDEHAGQGSATLNKYLKPDLLIIDDMGLKELPKRAGEYLLEIIMRRYELRSTLMTSNRPIEDWGLLLGDVATASAILDRLLQSAEIIAFKGKSYRISKSNQQSVKNNS